MNLIFKMDRGQAVGKTVANREGPGQKRQLGRWGEPRVGMVRAVAVV